MIVKENVSNVNSTAAHSDDEDQNELIEKQTFFGTDVSVEWLLKRLCERLKCPMVTTPQWILERLNKYTEKGLIMEDFTVEILLLFKIFLLVCKYRKIEIFIRFST